MTTNDDIPRLSVSVSRKLNLGNYESADVFVSLSNLRPDVSDEEIEAALEGSERVFVAIRRQVKALSTELREEPQAPARRRAG